MKRADKLTNIADEYEHYRRGTMRSLQDQAGKLRQELKKVETELEKARVAADRRKTYQPEVNGMPTCPYCSLDEDKPVLLKPMSSETEMDEWRCPQCNRDFTLSPP